MPHILAAQRDTNVVEAFDRYRKYLSTSRDHFPKSAYELATSEWYFNPTVHRCPHDAWLESAHFLEPSSGSRGELRSLTLLVRLLGAYHDGHIELSYPNVFAYRFDAPEVGSGHFDWHYDEFRVDAAGRLEHEIEWCGATTSTTSRWLIVASDVEFKWVPIVKPSPG